MTLLHKRKNLRNFNISLLVILSVLLALTLGYGCKTRKQKNDGVRQALVADSLKACFFQNQFVFSTLDARMDVAFTEDDKKQSLNAVMRIRHDSAIWISASPFFGIEVARMIITPDSVKILNRLNNTYLLAGRSYLTSLLGFEADFAMLQALLTGNDFPHFETDRFDIKQDGAAFTLTAQARNRLRSFFASSNLSINQSLKADATTCRILHNSISQTTGNNTIDTEYSKFTPLTSTPFAHFIKSIITQNNKKFTFEAEYKKINTNVPLSFPFTIPDSYTPMP